MLIEKKGKKELLMEDVVHVIVDDLNIELRGILGETREIKGKIKEIDLDKHTIILEGA